MYQNKEALEIEEIGDFLDIFWVFLSSEMLLRMMVEYQFLHGESADGLR